MSELSYSSLFRKNTAYALALFFERGIAFLLLPLYTQVLSPSEYGVYAVLLSFIAVSSFLYSLGIENNLFTFSAYPERDPDLMGTAFWTVAVAGTLFSAALSFLSGPVSIGLFQTSRYGGLVRLSAGILLTDAIIRFLLYRLIGKQQSGLYLAAGLFRGVLALAVNFFLLVQRGLGLKGVFLSLLFVNLLVMLLLLVGSRKTIRFRMDLHLVPVLMRFGSPVMLVSLFITLLNFFDRFLLERLVSVEEAGWYSAAYRIGFVINLAVTAFFTGALPYTAHLMKRRPDAYDVFARLLDYSFWACVSLFLFLCLFIQEIVRIRVFGFTLIHPSFWKAMPLVPAIALGYVFYGFFANFSLGFYHREKTSALAWIGFGSFVVNLVLNFAAIPRYASWGAAAATVGGFFFMAVASYATSRRFFPVRYHWKKIVTISCAAVPVYVLPLVQKGMEWPVKMVLFTLFCVIAACVLRSPGFLHDSRALESRL